MQLNPMVFSALTVAVLACQAPASAAGLGTAEQAVTLVKKGIAHIKAHGKDKAFADINQPDGAFKDRDLYVIVIDLNGRMLASAGNARMVGKDVSQIKDANGKTFVKVALDTAKASGKSWTDYMWPNPSSNVIEAKTTYLEVMGDVAVGCGVYK
ncbi:cache domain-containing protein [Pseudoduganella namucuonensis]|uniref:Single Cache domain 2-containing protein n=1 Tax=Pseudoduganella namucuonensis TaxID=1035707 RepID=A0A1I7LRY0_9BURK|nr:cache domain-containing protein [Pseudoduganella namucuonensis]SFV12445.1 Single Cache domain 2-containing protein [Pseudoduganella namucuonensis]